MLQCLLIDGSLTIQKVVKLTLSKYAVNVSSFNSLHEASVFISSADTKVDFIISDSSLEGTVTPESLKKLSIQAHAPILILNGSYQGVDEASFKKEGFFFFLKKPFESSTLISNVESLIKKPLPLKEDGIEEDDEEITEKNPVFAPPPPPPMDKTINIPPTISFKEELSLQEKMEQAETTDRIPDIVPSAFGGKEPSLKTTLPPPPPPVGTTPPPFIPNIPDIPVNRVESNKKTISKDIDSLNLPPPPFIDKKLHVNENTNELDSSKTKDVFSKKLPPIPSLDAEDSSSSPTGSIPFTPSKEYLEENIGKIVKEYLDSNLEDLVKQEVKNYCDAHFKTIATECIKEKINKLLEEKVSLSENS